MATYVITKVTLMGRNVRHSNPLISSYTVITQFVWFNYLIPVTAGKALFTSLAFVTIFQQSAISKVEKRLHAIVPL